MSTEKIYRKILTKENIFWDLVDKRGPDECWPWLGFCDKDGYGRVPAKETIGAHRAAWMLAHGQITSEEQVLHRCDNPPCCNERHLFLGDPAINHADKVAKGRHYHGEQARDGAKDFHRTLRTKDPERYQRVFMDRVRGVGNPCAKLTEEDVVAIRTCGGSQSEIAAKFGVTQTTIGGILRRKIWKHVQSADRYQPRLPKFSDDDIRTIRTCAGTQKEIAARFGVTQATISKIRLGRIWSHIK